MDAHIEIEIAQQAVLDDFEVQLAHAADDRLAGLLVFVGAERRILPLHHLEHFAELLALQRGLGLDGHRDHRFGKLDRLEQNRLGGVAKRVAGDRNPRADHADDVARLGRGNLLAAVGLDMPKLGGVFLLVFARIENAAIGLQPAGINPHVVQIAMLVGQQS